MISTPILLLTTCVVAAMAHPYDFAWNQPAYGLQPGFPQFDNYGNFGNFQPWFPIPQNTGPWVTTDDGVYQITAKAEGYQVEDLSVRIKNNSIRMRGDVYGSNSKSFSFSYTMPQDGNANQATAVLTSNGYLIVKIPLTGSVGNVDRVVPITKSTETYVRE